ncbi:hypothetical protein D5S17_20285 [Pseudonocardiaceae bacterium YIM PH 21723]|nr:hypothetical protein D5S17_20285 [Pseudonocardiaceae bacterium YIM PH 21723]
MHVRTRRVIPLPPGHVGSAAADYNVTGIPEQRRSAEHTRRRRVVVAGTPLIISHKFEEHPGGTLVTAEVTPAATGAKRLVAALVALSLRGRLKRRMRELDTVLTRRR